MSVGDGQPLISKRKAEKTPDPGHNPFLATVWANQPSGAIMRQMTQPDQVRFGAGTMVVRENRPNGVTSPPDLLSVMIKREPGFNSASGDWEFVVISGDRTKVLHRESTGACFNCHTSQKNHDYVFSYAK